MRLQKGIHFMLKNVSKKQAAKNYSINIYSMLKPDVLARIHCQVCSCNEMLRNLLCILEVLFAVTIEYKVPFMLRITTAHVKKNLLFE